MSIVLNGNTGIQNVLGSASAPADTNTTTPTTGVYYPSATTWGVSTAGTNALYIDTSQNVGIGTTSPSAKLQIQGSQASGTANVLYLDNSSTTGTTLSSVSFSNAGNVKASIAACVAGDGYMTFSNNNNTEKMRLDAFGSLLVGTTATTGNASNSNYIAGGIFTTANGTLSVANSTATTFVTLPSLGNGVFIVSIGIPGAAGASNYLSTALVSTQTSTSVVSALHSGTNVSITTSGLNVQVTQTGGTTYTMSWSIIRVA